AGRFVLRNSALVPSIRGYYGNRCRASSHEIWTSHPGCKWGSTVADSTRMSSFDKKSLDMFNSGACGNHLLAPSALPGDADTGLRGHASGTVCMIPTPGGCDSP